MNSQKPIIFISDIHLGAGKVNDFHKTFELHRLFDYAAENASGLVLNGDILELLQSELTEIYLQHHGIFTHLFDLARRLPVTYVIGNHDELVAMDYRADKPSYFLGSPITVTLEYTNEKLGILAEHGNQYDLLNSREDPLDLSEGSSPGDRIVRILGWLERNVNPKLDNTLESVYLDYKKVLRKISLNTLSFARLVTPAHPDYVKLGGDYSEFEAGARDILRSDKFSVCVMGHTHQQLIREFTPEQDDCSGLYVNSGSWVGDDYTKSPPIFVEISATHARIIDAGTFEVLEEAERNIKIAKRVRKLGKKEIVGPRS